MSSDRDLYRGFLTRAMLPAHAADCLADDDLSGHGVGRVGRLCRAYEYLLDMFYPDMSPLDRLQRKWAMLCRFYPRLPCNEQESEAMAKSVRAGKFSRMGWGTQMRPGRPVQLSLF